MKSKNKEQYESRTVELVKSSYQPTKVDMDEEFTLRKPDGTAPTVEEIAQTVLQPASIRLIDKPSKRR